MQANLFEVWRQLRDLPDPDRERRLSELDAEDPAAAAKLRGMFRAEAEPDDSAAESDDFGGYALTRLLGQGGSAAVWIGEKPVGRGVHRAAIKVFDPLASSLAARERENLSGLNHDSIARFIGAGESGGRAWVAAELVEDAVSIAEYCDREGLVWRERAQWICRVCEALEYAHARRVFHHDISPANILITREGRLKLVDFGCGDFVPEAEGRARVAGFTPGFAAPELARGESALAASDVYSVGKVLGALTKGATDPSGDLRRIVAKASRESPADRYVSAGRLREDLERLLASRPVEAHGDAPASYRASLWLRRNRRLLAVMVAIQAALAAGLWIVMRERDRSEAARLLLEARRAVESGGKGWLDAARFLHRSLDAGATPESLGLASEVVASKLMAPSFRWSPPSGSELRAVEWNPGGVLVVTDREWGIAGGALTPHPFRAHAVAASPSGAAVMDEAGRTSIAPGGHAPAWIAAAGKPKSADGKLAFTPSGQCLLSESDRGWLLLWESRKAASWRALLEGGVDRWWSGRRDGRDWIVASSGGSLLLWACGSDDEPRRFEASGPVGTVSRAGYDHAVAWRLERFDHRSMWRGWVEDREITAEHRGEGGPMIASHPAVPEWAIWDQEGKSVTVAPIGASAVTASASAPVSSVVYAPDGSLFAAAGGRLIAWPPDGKGVRVDSGAGSVIAANGLAAVCDQAAGSASAAVAVVDTAARELRARMFPEIGAESACVFAPDGKRLMAYAPAGLALYEVAQTVVPSAAPLPPLPPVSGPPAGAAQVRSSPSGEYFAGIVAVGKGRVFRVWNREGTAVLDEPVAETFLSDLVVLSAAPPEPPFRFTSNNHALVVASETGPVIVDLASRKRAVIALPAGIRMTLDTPFASDGVLMAVANGTEVLVYRIADGALALRFDMAAAVTGLAFSGEAGWLRIESAEGASMRLVHAAALRARIAVLGR